MLILTLLAVKNCEKCRIFSNLAEFFPQICSKTVLELGNSVLFMGKAAGFEPELVTI
jgi:hypothetical protein